MLIDKKTLEKLPHILKAYTNLRFNKVTDVEIEMFETKEHFRKEPAAAKSRWRRAPAGTRWGGSEITGWFRGDIKLPAACDRKKVFMHFNCSGGLEDWQGAQTLFILDGRYKGVFDPYHEYVMLADRGKANRTYHVAFDSFAGLSRPPDSTFDEGIVVPKRSRTFNRAEICLEREDVSAFVFDLDTLLSLSGSLDENTLRGSCVIKGLVNVYACVDPIPRETGEESWRPKLAEARRIMAPLLKAKNGSTTPWIGITGHSHIDPAWLWSISEGKRKYARTFSSVLNLMDQYKELNFFQGSPYQTEVVKQEYPEIFDGIKEMVDAGRWEPNGAVWIETDCYIPSGESLVRQFLVGQSWTREHFGYTSDTVWLPDSAGVSAAMPQIMKGCGVEFYCTAKIEWKDISTFPFETFMWKGIDGTSVLVHVNIIHTELNADSLVGTWKDVRHKDVQDRKLYAFGLGDGGGGPRAEEIERLRRMKDLEGCPKTEIMSVSRFMRKLKNDLKELPEWVGDLYIQAHRGTLTSAARCKRGNRLAEIAIHDAELFSTMASIQGASYPAAEFLAIWKEVLRNQFHDLVTGTSIAEAHIEVEESYVVREKEARGLASRALGHLNGSGLHNRQTPKNLLAINTLGWARTGEIVLSGVPSGLSPAGECVTSQHFTDLEGRRQTAMTGLSLPALGGAAVALKKSGAAGPSPFKLTSQTVETPHARIRFGKAGGIQSLVDRSSKRELVEKGEQLNSFVLYGDYPMYYDCEDIDLDYELKAAAQDRLVSRKVVADGPLQLRIRSEYRIGERSSLVQDMVFHASSSRIDFETRVDWAEIHRLLKVHFPLNLLAEKARHEIQFGHVERETHRNLPHFKGKFEVSNQKWSDISESDFGVALLNDCKYGIGVKAANMGLSLMRSHRGPDDRADEGRHFFSYALLPHAGPFSVESVVRPSYELNFKAIAVPVGPSAQELPGLASVDAANVIIENVKWAEDGAGFVVRLYEAAKCACKAAVSFGREISSVEETNMLEEHIKQLSVNDGCVRLSFKPFEIKTLKCVIG